MFYYKNLKINMPPQTNDISSNQATSFFWSFAINDLDVGSIRAEQVIHE